MKAYVRHIWKHHCAVVILAVIFNISFLSIWTFASLYQPELWSIIFVIILATWGIGLFIAWDSHKSGKEAGLIAVSALIINVYSVVWYYFVKKRLKPSIRSPGAEQAAEIELCDSRVSAIRYDAEKRGVLIKLSPALIFKNRKIWTQTVEALLLGINESVLLPACPLTIADGCMSVNGRDYNAKFTIPFTEKGPCSLGLHFDDGTNVEFTGNEIAITGLGQLEYLEDSGR